MRAVNGKVIETVQLKSLDAILTNNLLKIEKHENGEYTVTFDYLGPGRNSQNYDFVIVCCGFSFDPTLFAENCRPVVNVRRRLPEVKHDWESKNISGLYFAGNLMHVPDYRVASSFFIHGFRHNIWAMHHYLLLKY